MPSGVGYPGPIGPPLQPADGTLWAFKDGRWQAIDAATTKAALGLATSTTDNAVIRADGTAGGTQNSGVIIDDSNNLTGIGSLLGTGPIVAGTASADVVTNANTVTPGLQANGTTATLASASVSRWAASSSSPSYILAKSRGTSVGSHAVVASADILGRISFVGDDGTAFRDGAAIRATVEEATPGSGAMGTKLEFLTAPNGSVTPAVALTLDNAKLATFAGNIAQSGAGTVSTGTGTVTLNGNVIVTTGKTITAPSGIIFSDETMSTYDEGTWTPTIAGDATAGTQTYSFNEGRYTRVGNRVICDFNILMTAKGGTTAGNIEVRGFPFTIKNTGSYRPSLVIGTYTQVTLTTGTQLLGAGLANTTRATLYSCGSAAAINTILAADITNTFLLYGTMSYEI